MTIARRAITPKQKRVIITRLLSLWESSPDERLGQFIVNAIGDPTGMLGASPDEIHAAIERRIYNVEDFDLIDKMAKRIEGDE